MTEHPMGGTEDGNRSRGPAYTAPFSLEQHIIEQEVYQACIYKSDLPPQAASASWPPTP